MSVFETSCTVMDFWLPKIHYGARCITARTNLLLQLVSLFSTSRKITISAATRTITICTRKWWIRSFQEQVPFQKVRYVGVSELTVGASPGYTPDGFGFQDQDENFIPYLMTVEGRKVELVSFYGEGSVRTGWWGVFLGDDLIDFRGRQEKRSREFAERVAMMVGVPLGSDSAVIAQARSSANKIQCHSCGHYNAGTPVKCLYCGAEITREG